MKTILRIIAAACAFATSAFAQTGQLATSYTANGTAGKGFVQLANQSAAPSTPTSAGRLYWDSSNRLSWIGTNGYTRTFDGTANTANRIYTLPDAAIVISGSASALTSGRVPFVTTSGLLTDASTLTFSSGTLTAGTGYVATAGGIAFSATGQGATFHGGGTITGASGAITIAASGSNQPITATASGTAGFVAKGTGTNDSAAAGNFGEFVTAIRTTPLSLSSGSCADVTSITLTAGDWDVSGNVAFQINGATTVTYFLSAISTTSASFGSQGDGTNSGIEVGGTALGTSLDTDIVTPVVRVSIASTTTVYLTAQSAFAINTCKAYGYIRARRQR